MGDLRSLLWFVLLVLLCAILILILINALRRTFFGTQYYGRTRNARSARDKYVDIYATSKHALPIKDALPGMTALVDMGAMNLETGIYILQDVWVKISVPEIGECYQILRGESAGKQHTIKPSFVHEIRVPSETQIVDNEHLYQELQESTLKVYIHRDIRMPCHMTIPTAQTNPKFTNVFPHGRLLEIINTSPKFAFGLEIGKDHIITDPQRIQHVHLFVDANNPLAPYQLGALSSFNQIK